MKQSWILVSNSEFAQIFLKKDKQPMTLIHLFEHKESKEKVSQLVTDRMGKGQSKGWQTRYGLNEGQDIIAHERAKFALELFHFCKKGFDDHQFHKLIIFAAPKFLGEIRRIFKPLLAHCPSKEFSKEIPSFLDNRSKNKIHQLLLGNFIFSANNHTLIGSLKIKELMSRSQRREGVTNPVLSRRKRWKESMS